MPRPPAGLPSAQNPPRRGWAPGSFSALCALCRGQEIAERTLKRRQRREWEAPGGETASSGGKAGQQCLSLLHVRVTGFLERVWAECLQDGRVGPSVSLLVPKGQAGPQVSQTRCPLGVIPGPLLS